MSELIVKVVTIDDVIPHPNADRLDLAVVGGWNCVVAKGLYKPGDRAIYIPIDSILPFELESKLFPPNSKVKLSKSRIRTIKLRGAISQGLLVAPSEVGMESMPVGTDVAERLGITKYEPPTAPAKLRGGKQVSKKESNSHFFKYTDIQNFKHYNQLFEFGEPVYISEKLHGTSARYGWFPTEVNSLWKKIKRFLGLLPKYEFCYGSRNVQLQYKKKWSGFYEENVYGKILAQEGLDEKLEPGYAVYGEIIGTGIQKNYTYGMTGDQQAFYAYDVMKDGRWLDYGEFVKYCDLHCIKRVPELFVGLFDAELADRLRRGDSTIGGQKIREGIVIKSLTEQVSMVGRKCLKYVNDDYLLRDDNTEYH